MFCTGPAGTGKSYIVTHVAAKMLVETKIEKIVLTRPIVATEDIGYLPGTLEEKISPYLLPLMDALEDHIGVVGAKRLIEEGLIEFAPLAFLRGRSLNNCLVILDEAQNVTREQMKMFLTRMGRNATFAINGDYSQSDLPNPEENGLCWAVDRLRGTSEKIAIVNFSSKEIVRNPLIETMLKYLDIKDSKKPEKRQQNTNTVCAPEVEVKTILDVAQKQTIFDKIRNTFK